MLFNQNQTTFNTWIETLCSKREMKVISIIIKNKNCPVLILCLLPHSKEVQKKEHDLYKVITVFSLNVIIVVHDIELRFLNTHHCHFSVPPGLRKFTVQPDHYFGESDELMNKMALILKA